MNGLTIACAQANPTVGDIVGAGAQVRRLREEARLAGADIVVFPELFLSGYPPEDLVLRPSFLRAVRHEVEALARLTAEPGPALIVGAPWAAAQGGAAAAEGGGAEGSAVYNAAVVMDEGEIRRVCCKRLLPNYHVFDEARVFAVGAEPRAFDLRGVRLGVALCEDMWRSGPCEALVADGARALLVLNGSPFSLGKAQEREAAAIRRAQATGVAMVCVNQVGGQDELTFDGASFAVQQDGALAWRAPSWEEALIITRLMPNAARLMPNADGMRIASGAREPLPSGAAAMYNAATMGLRDYITKNGFHAGAVLGLSGGVDSAIVAAMAVDALGADRVLCLFMPSRYSSPESAADALECAKRLGVRCETIPIDPITDSMETSLRPLFGDATPDTTEENIQARMRGALVMAAANKFHKMALSTGNKSELSVGYATLYGDMNGGFNPLKDIYKTQAYALGRWRASARPVGGLGPEGASIPERIFTRPPTAELREDQRDEDSLPPYPQLDAFLTALVDEERPLADAAACAGMPPALAQAIAAMVARAEHKRRQAPPGPMIGSRAYGRARRYPITNKYTPSLDV